MKVKIYITLDSFTRSCNEQVFCRVSLSVGEISPYAGNVHLSIVDKHCTGRYIRYLELAEKDQVIRLSVYCCGISKSLFESPDNLIGIISKLLLESIPNQSLFDHFRINSKLIYNCIEVI